MNKILSTLVIATGLFSLTGCDDYDDRYTSEYTSVARLEVYGEQEMTSWTINDTENYDISILRSGYDISVPTTVTVYSMTDEDWTAYAAMYGMKR